MAGSQARGQEGALKSASRIATVPNLHEQVNMFVNGNQVPFPMKIGEAGEAFFVFETDADVPDNLVTSPLLEATQPGHTNADAQLIGRFGAKESPEKQPEAASTDMQEPEFLDLNAPELSPHEQGVHQDASGEENGQASLLNRVTQLSKAVVGGAVEYAKSANDKLEDHAFKEAANENQGDEETFLKERAFAAQNSARPRASSFKSNKGDDVLPKAESVDGPDVLYTDGKPVAFARDFETEFIFRYGV